VVRIEVKLEVIGDFRAVRSIKKERHCKFCHKKLNIYNLNTHCYSCMYEFRHIKEFIGGYMSRLG